MDLAAYRTKILEMVGDETGARFDNDMLDEGLRLALAEYDQFVPILVEMDKTIDATGKRMALGTLTGLIKVLGVRRADYEEIEGWYFFRLGATQFQTEQVVVEFIRTQTPGESVTLLYTKKNGIEDLDSVTLTTVEAANETTIVYGAAGHACRLRAALMAEASYRPGIEKFIAQGEKFLEEFRRRLQALRGQESWVGFYPSTGMPVDPER